MSIVNPEELQIAEIEYIKKLEIKKHLNDMLIDIESIIYYRDLANNQDIIDIINTAFCIDEKNDVKQVLKNIDTFKQIYRGNIKQHIGVFKKFDKIMENKIMENKIMENKIIIISDLYEFTCLIYFLINFTKSFIIFILKINNSFTHRDFNLLIKKTSESCIKLYDNLFKLHIFIKERKIEINYQSMAIYIHNNQKLKNINMNEYINELKKYIIEAFIVANDINKIQEFIKYIKLSFQDYLVIINNLEKNNEINITDKLLEDFFDIISQNINNLSKNTQLIEILNNLVYLIKYLNLKYLNSNYLNQNFHIIQYGIKIYISIQKLIEYLHNTSYIIIYDNIYPTHITVAKDKIENYLSHEDLSKYDLNLKLNTLQNIHNELSNFISQPSLKSSSLKLSLREPSLRESSLKKPSLREPSLKKPSLREPSLRELSLRKLSLREPSLRELSLREPSLRKKLQTFNEIEKKDLKISTIRFNISNNSEYIQFVNFVKLQVLNYLFESYTLANSYFEGFYNYLLMNKFENIKNSKLVINLTKLFKIINNPDKITEDINNFIGEIINLIININLIFYYNNINNNKIIILYGIYCITLLKILLNNDRNQTIIYTQFTYNPKLQLTSYLVNFFKEIFKYDFDKDVRTNTSSDIYSNIYIYINAIHYGYYIYDDTIIAVDKIKSSILNDNKKIKAKSIIESIQFNIADTNKYIIFVNFIKLTVLNYLSVFFTVNDDSTLINISNLFHIINNETINADIKILISEIIKLIVNINLLLYYNTERDIKNILIGVHCINLLKILINENQSKTIIYYKYNYDYRILNNELLEFIKNDYNYNFNEDIDIEEKKNIYENIQLQIILINTNPIFNIKKTSSKQKSVKSDDITADNPETINIFISKLKTAILNYLYEVIHHFKNDRLNEILLENNKDIYYIDLNYIKHIQIFFDIIQQKIGNKKSINISYIYLLYNIKYLITNIIYLLLDNTNIIILKGFDNIILLNKFIKYIIDETQFITYKYYNYDNIITDDDLQTSLQTTFINDLERVIKEKQSLTNDAIYENIHNKINAINDNYTYYENDITFKVKLNGGGNNKYKKTENKITVIYKKKEYTRVIYICERKKYIKLNKTYMLLSKFKKI